MGGFQHYQNIDKSLRTFCNEYAAADEFIFSTLKKSKKLLVAVATFCRKEIQLSVIFVLIYLVTVTWEHGRPSQSPDINPAKNVKL